MRETRGKAVFRIHLVCFLCLLCSFSLLGRAAPAGNTTLLDAAESGDRVTALRLLSQHADANLAGADGTTAIMYAAANDDLELVRALIKAGAKVNVKNCHQRGVDHRLRAGHRRAVESGRRSEHEKSGRRDAAHGSGAHRQDGRR